MLWPGHDLTLNSRPCGPELRSGIALTNMRTFGPCQITVLTYSKVCEAQHYSLLFCLCLYALRPVSVCRYSTNKGRMLRRIKRSSLLQQHSQRGGFSAVWNYLFVVTSVVIRVTNTRLLCKSCIKKKVPHSISNVLACLQFNLSKLSHLPVLLLWLLNINALTITPTTTITTTTTTIYSRDNPNQ